ncbi:MAG TPA: hypothetical protein VHX88_14160 [Solirubrobacteraceae bacterium]|jgi:hypothetical protein|nr:hypothetical protein [Solirubrobacteraceae bacterium]
MNPDEWLPDPAVRTGHRRESSARAAELWDAAGSVKLRDCRLLGRLVRARIPSLRSDLSFRDLFHERPFLVLDEGETYSLSGLCGRIWSVRGEFARLDSPQEFLDWSERGTVRVLFAHYTEPTPRGSAIVSEVRVVPTDRLAGLRLRAMGPFISAFQGLVGVEGLAAAVRASRRA